MTWIDTAAGWFIGLATSPAAPYLLVSLIAFAFAILVLGIRVWLDMQETKALADYRGHVPPRQWPADFVDTQPWPAPSNPVQRPLHTAKVPPVIKNVGDSPLYVNFEGKASKECCGACDGSKCGTTVVEFNRVIKGGESIQTRTGQVPPRRNPQRPNLSRANFDAAFRPKASASDDEPYRGSYYGEAISQVLNGETPAPVSDDKQGREFQ